nr:reverse transcriptase domain-containing protein [Tanacetum cinerariifolium]
RNLKERLGPRDARTRSGSQEQRRDRSKSPREKGPERRTVFKRLEKYVFHRLRDKEKNVSAHSRGSEWKSYYSSHRDTESWYQSSRSKETEIASEKHRHKREYYRRTKAVSESEGSVGEHWKLKPKKQKSSMEDDVSQPWVCEETDPFTPRIRYFDFPKTRMPSHIKTYDGSEDPEDHLKIFQAAAKMKRWAMPTWCHMFNYTLTGNARKKCIKYPMEIHNIKQRNKESTKEFVRRYKLECMDVKGASECMKIFGFMHGITNPELIKRLHDKIPKSMDEMMSVTATFLRGEMAASNRERKKSFPFTLLTKTLREILALDKGKFKPPSPMTTPVEKKNASKFCWKTLTFDQGVKAKPRKRSGKDSKEGENLEKRQTAGNINGEEDRTEGPMIIEAEIGGHYVHHIYMDGGSSSEILYEHCFSKFCLEIKNQLIPANTPLVGFSGEIIWPLGQISLLVRIGNEEHSTFARMNFMVVRSPSPYNEIIGRPKVRKIRAIPSTAHGMIKFPVAGGIVTLQSSRIIPLECSMVSEPEVLRPSINQVKDEKIQVTIHSEQTIAIGSTLTEEGRKELCELGEITASNRERKKSFPYWKQETGQKQNFKRGNFQNEQRMERKQDRFTLLTKTPREILALDKGKFKPPSPMTTPIEKRNANKFCEFHGEVGHTTDGCMHLKRQIEEMLKAGKLSHLIKELKQNHEKDQAMIAKKGETSGKDKSLAILMVQPWQRIVRQRITQTFSQESVISFATLGEEDWTEGPMIIEAEMGGHCVHRIYVDGGSSSEILYKHCFSKFRSEIKNQLIPANTPLVEFSGEIIWPLGQISLLVRIGDEEHSTSAWMNFMVVRSPSHYNRIIGRPGVRKIRAILSTAHGMIKFPVADGIVTLQSSRIIPLECSMVSEPGVPRLLRRHLDVFAWKPADMTGVPWHIAEHRLNVREGCLPIRQKKRGQAPERNKAINEEVKKLVEADIMKEVHYHSWLSNPVIVKKHDDSRRMCVDFKDLNKACPKDGYPLPEIDWKVESLRGYPYKCFLDAYKGYHQIKMAEEDEEKTAFITSQGILSELQMLTAPKEKKELIMYQAAAKEAISAVLMTERDGKQVPVYFVSRALQGPKINHTPMEKLILALRFELGEHDIQYRTKTSVKGQILADFIVERSKDDAPDTPMEDREELPDPWIFFTNGSSCIDGSGAGLIITNPEGMKFTYDLSKCGLKTSGQPGKWNLHSQGVKHDQVPRKVYEYLTEGILPEEKKKARTVRRKTGRYVVINESKLKPRRGNQGTVEVKNKNWVEEVSHVLWAHRTMIKSSNGETPFSLTYGAEAVIPTEIGMPTLRTAEVDMVKNNVALGISLDLLEEKREQAVIQEAMNKAKMEGYYNARVRSTSSRPGDFVYRSNEASHAKDGGKLGP